MKRWTNGKPTIAGDQGLMIELQDARKRFETDSLKRTTISLEVELGREQMKKTFLSAELGRPINVPGGESLGQ